MPKSSAYVAFLAAKDAETGLSALVSLIDGSERIVCAPSELSFLLRSVLHDIAGCRAELEGVNNEAKRRSRI